MVKQSKGKRNYTISPKGGAFTKTPLIKKDKVEKDSVDFEFEVEEHLDVKTKKPVKLNLNFRKIYDPYFSPAKSSKRTYLTEDEYKKHKKSARKKSKAKAKKIKKKPLKISGKKRLHWSNGKFVSNAEMEGLRELAKKKKTTAKKLASKHQQGQLLQVLSNNYNQHNAKQLILDANKKNKNLIVNIVLDTGKTYAFSGANLLSNPELNNILDQQLNQTYYSIFNYGKDKK